jgi:hypothetical protein
VASGASALSVARLRRRSPGSAQPQRWLPTWSTAAAMRGVRAAILVPGLFALTDKVIGNVQMATFAAFGSFATLVLANFGGGRRDKLIAHTGLAVTGSVLLVIGTAVTSSTALAVIVTVPVTFPVFFAGVAGPNAASGVTAALLAYVLPAASPGTIGMVPDRLAGWWIASVAGTAAVLLLSPPAPGDRLRGAASKLAATLATELDALARGQATEDLLAACIAAKRELIAVFTATPFRPTGLTTTDQALADIVELLEWCTGLCVDAVHERGDLTGAAPEDLDLLASAAVVLREAGSLLTDSGAARPDLERLEAARRRSLDRVQSMSPDSDDFPADARLAFHASTIAITSLMIGADALVAAGLASPEWLADARTRWFGSETGGPMGERRLARASRYANVAASNASLRSVWFINSLRGSLALALAIGVADLTSVQHGFWVVLGALSVLRTNAASTGSTALQALTGTAIGFAVGAAVLLLIGTSTTLLWAVLPIAVFVAAYAPGAAPFVVGQAAFTVTVAVLFNLIVPEGWQVGVIRIEDVALGCAVSIVVGTLFWPRGVSSLVGDDLADAFRSGAAYLSQAVAWVCGLRPQSPDRGLGAIDAGLRLDEALRGFLAEQGTKHIAKEELWRLVGGTLRLRLTAHAIAGLPRSCAGDSDETQALLNDRAEVLDAWFERLAAQLGRPRGQPVTALAPPDFGDDGADGRPHSRRTIWLSEHLDHLTQHLSELVQPAAHVAEFRRRPWWR